MQHTINIAIIPLTHRPSSYFLINSLINTIADQIKAKALAHWRKCPSKGLENQPLGTLGTLTWLEEGEVGTIFGEAEGEGVDFGALMFLFLFLRGESRLIKFLIAAKVVRIIESLFLP